MASADERASRLEENLYFLEERVKALDGQIAAQQAELDALGKQVRQLVAMMHELRQALAAGGQGRQPTELPPHHIARFW